MSARQVKFKDQMLNLDGPQLKAGDKAPDFACAALGAGGLEIVHLQATAGRPRMFSVVPSLDTPVCSLQTKRFDQEMGSLKETTDGYTVSLDMPFAQKRFCGTENCHHLRNLSDLHDHSFGKNYGVLIEGLPIPLLCRAIFVLDKNDTIAYCEYVPEVGQHPNYDKALEALRSL